MGPPTPALTSFLDLPHAARPYGPAEQSLAQMSLPTRSPGPALHGLPVRLALGSSAGKARDVEVSASNLGQRAYTKSGQAGDTARKMASGSRRIRTP